jgi:hypothetical protein
MIRSNAVSTAIAFLDSNGVWYASSYRDLTGATFGGDMYLAGQNNANGSNHFFGPVIFTGNNIGIGTNLPQQALHVVGTVRATAFEDQGGTSLMPLVTSTNLDFGAATPSTSEDLPVHVAGAVVGDAVSLGIPVGSVTTDGIYHAWVSATDTVTVRFTNCDQILTVDPASGTFKVLVWKY